jgi:eukaryotic-like serine/threonine-protein kinase
MAIAADLVPARYRSPELVARGGMGAVYCATDQSLGRVVAIKVLDERLASDPAVRKRFEREALAAARLSGEAGIVTIFDVGTWNERPFIVMEYIRGRSLQQVVREEGAQPPSVALDWLEQAARGLDYAHEHGVVHRDVKPSNLLLDEQARLRIVDFGVASAAGLDSLTQTGTVIGTAGYLAPEQAEGRPATPASDRYGLGIVAFELLAGSRPFENASATAEAAAHIHAPVPSLSRYRPGLPPAVDGVLAKALAKDPAQRFATCRAFVHALRYAFHEAEEPTHVVPRAAPVPAHAPRRSRAWVPLLLLLLALAGIASGVIYATDRSGSKKGARAPKPATIVQTVTARQQTVVRTVTATAQQPSPPATSTPPSTSTSTFTSTATTTPAPTSSGQTLASEGYQKLQAGDYAGAVPLLEQAAQQLQGTGSLDEAYNDYNLAFALAKTEGCSARVLQLLDASEGIQGHRSDIDRLRAACGRAGA